MSDHDLTHLRDLYSLPVTDEQLHELPYITFPEGSKELTYMRGRRAALGGYLPARRPKSDSFLSQL